MSDLKDKIKETFTEEVAKYFGIGAVVAGFAYMGLNLVDPHGDIEAVKRAQTKQAVVSEAQEEEGLNDFIDQDVDDGLRFELGKSKSLLEEQEDLDEDIDSAPAVKESTTAPVVAAATAPKKKSENKFEFDEEDLREVDRVSRDNDIDTGSDDDFDSEDDLAEDLVAAAAADDGDDDDPCDSNPDALECQTDSSSDDVADADEETKPPPGFDVTLISNNTEEDGTFATFSVIGRGRAPVGEVSIVLTSNNIDEAVVTSPAPDLVEAADGSIAIITFTPDDHTDERIVTVTGVDDTIIDGDQNWSITVEAVSVEDPLWDFANTSNTELQKTVNGINVDDETRGTLLAAEMEDSTSLALISPYTPNIIATNSYLEITFDKDVDCTTPNSDNFRVIAAGSDLPGTYSCPSSDTVRFSIGAPYSDFTAFYAEDITVQINQWSGFVADYPNTSDNQPLSDIDDNGKDGGATTWNNNYYSPASFQFKIQPQVSAIAAGTTHTCALTVDNGGSILCWGQNDKGALGTNSTEHLGDDINEMGSGLYTAGALHGSTVFGNPVTEIFASFNNTCIKDTAGDIHCWGENRNGSLGLGHGNIIGDDESLSSGNTRVFDGGSVTVNDFDLGINHSCAIIDNGLKCWGDNSFGQLGTEGTTSSTSPGADIDINGLTPLKVAVGLYFTCVIRDNTVDDVVCFGKNEYGQLGLDHTKSIGDQPGEMGTNLLTVDLQGLVPVDIKAGSESVCILSADDKLYCWGRNHKGQLGQEVATASIGSTGGSMSTINPISLPSNPANWNVNDNVVCVNYSDFSTYCFGDNSFGQLGRGNTTSIGNGVNDITSLAAMDFGSGDDAQSLYVDTGGYHTCAILASGKVKCFGNNKFGQLGIQSHNTFGDDSHEIGDVARAAYIKNKRDDDFFFNMTPQVANGSTDTDLDIYLEFDDSVSYDEYTIAEATACTGAAFNDSTGTWTTKPSKGAANTQSDVLSVSGGGTKVLAFQMRNSSDTTIKSQCILREFVLISGSPICSVVTPNFVNSNTNVYSLAIANEQALEVKVSADSDCTSDGGATWDVNRSFYFKDVASGDGPKNISIQCRNDSTSSCSTRTFELDTTGPNITPVTTPDANSPLATETIVWDVADPGTGINSGSVTGIRHECSLTVPAAHSKFSITGFRACADVCTSYSGDDNDDDVTCTLDHENVDGSYTLSVRSIDALGNTGPQQDYAWLSDQTGPVCSITAIDGGLVGAFPGTSRLDPVPFTFNCTDAGSLVDTSEIECALIQTIPPATPAYDGTDEVWVKPCTSIFSGDVDNEIENEYTVFIRAKDNATNQGLPATFTWNVDTLEPEIVSISAPNDPAGAYIIGDVVPITITFSEAVDITGTPQITLETGSTDAVVDYVSGSGTTQLLFNYTVGVNEWSDDLAVKSVNIDLNGGSIRDEWDNHCDANDDNIGTDCTIPTGVGALENTSDVVINGTRLIVADVTSSTSNTSSNSNGAYKIGDTVSIQVRFEDPEDPGTPAKNIIEVASGTPTLTLETGGIDQTISYVSGTGTDTITFTYVVQDGDSSADLDYVATTSLALAGATLKDTDGNDAVITLPAPAGAGSLGNNKALVIDGIRPILNVVSSTATDGSANIKIENDVIPITATFDDNVYVVTTGGTPYITVDTNPDKNVNYSSGSGSTILTFNYTVENGHNSLDLDYSSTAALVLNSGTIRDAADNDAVIVLDTPGGANSLGGQKAIIVDTTEPTITNVTATNSNTSSNTDGEYKIGDTITVQVDFSEPVNVVTTGGTPGIMLELGSTDREATYVGGTGTASLTFDYTVQDGDASSDLDYVDINSFALNGGTIKDFASNDLVLTLPALNGGASIADNKDIVIDGIRPETDYITAVEADGTYNMGDSINVQIVFDEAVTVAGGTPQITLETGTSDQTLNYVSGSGSATLVFSYTVALDHVSPDLDVQSASISLNGATMRDTSDNDIVLTLPIASSGNQLDERKALVIDGIPPRITSVTATNSNTSANPSGAYKIGDVVNVQVIYDDTVYVNTTGGTPSLTLETGTTDQVINYSSGSGSTTLVFQYTVQDGDNSSDLEYINTTALALNSGTIKDINDNDAINTLPSIGGGSSLSDNKTLVIDGIRPQITNVTSSTSDGLQMEGNTITVQVVFDDNVYPSTGASSTGDIYLTLETGATDRNAEYNGTGNGTSTIELNYVVVAGDVTPDLATKSTAVVLAGGKTLKDNSGNDVVLTLPTAGGSDELDENKAIIIDGVEPTIVSVTSSSSNTSANSDGEYKIGDTINVTVNFSEVVNLGGAGAVDVAVGVGGTNTSQLANYASGDGSASYNFDYVVQQDDVSADLAQFGASLILGGTRTIRDAAGNDLDLTFPTAGGSDELAENKAIVVDGIPPRITSVTSSTSNGTYIQGDSIVIQVNFDQNVTVAGGTPSIDVNVGPTNTTQTANMTGGSGSSTLEFTYVVQQDDVSSDLSLNSTSIALGGATIRDDSDNDLINSIPTAGGSDELDELKAIVIDGIPPRIVNVTATNPNATYIIGDTINITVEFDQAIYPSTGASSTSDISFAVETGTNDPSATYNGSGNGTTTITFDYTVITNDISSDLALKDAAISLAGGKTLKDVNGNDAILTFPTAGGTDELDENKAIVIDGIVPTITNVTAVTADGLYKQGDVIQIQVDFSEDVSVTSGTPQFIIEAGTVDATAAYAAQIDGDSLRFDFTVGSTMDSAGVRIAVQSASLDLNGGTIVDTPGNGINTTFPTASGSDELDENRNIRIDGVVPTITLATSTSSDGTYNQYSADLNVRVTFSEPVTTASGSPTFDLETGSSDAAVTYASGDTSANYDFTYNILAGHSTADLDIKSSAITGATITDIAGNPLASYNFPTAGGSDELAENKAIVIDGVSPQITFCTAGESDGTYIVGETIRVVCEFDEDITVSGTPQITLDTGDTVDFNSQPASDRVRFVYTIGSGDSSSDLSISSTSIDLNGGTIQDAAGNNVVLSIPTAGVNDELDERKDIVIDGVIPVITNVTASNSNGEYGIGDTINVQVTFDDSVYVVTTGGTPAFDVETGASDGTASYASGSGSTTLVFNYTVSAGENSSDLALADSAISLNSGTIKDVNGNDVTLTFPTAGGSDELDENKAIVIDGTRPTITSIAASTSNGTYIESDNIDITVTFSEAVDVNTAGGTPSFVVETGSAVADGVASYISGTGTTVLTFRYTVAALHETSDLSINSTSIALNGGVIQDSADNNATLSIPTAGGSDELDENAAIVIDGVAPTVVSENTAQSSGTYSIGDTINVRINFSEAVTISSGTPQITLDTGDVITYSSGDGTSTLTFNYTVTVNDSTAELDITSSAITGGTITDIPGNTAVLTLPTAGGSDELEENKSIVIDGVRPTISSVSSSTSNGTYGVGETIAITVTFDDTVNVASGTPSFEVETGTSDGTATYASGSGSSVLTFNYTIASGHQTSDLAVKDSSITLNGGTIRDVNSNDAVLTFPTAGGSDELDENKAIVIDGIIPTISSESSDVGSGTYGIGDTIVVEINFNDSVIVAGGTPSITIGTGDTLTYSGGSGTSTLEFSYIVSLNDNDSDLDVSSASIALNGATIQDGTGNNATLTLPTGGSSLEGAENVVIDGIRPTISGATSLTADGYYNDPDVIQIHVNFSEAVTLSGGSPTVPLDTGGTASYASGSGTSQWTFNYTVADGHNSSDLNNGTPMSSSGVTIVDGAGNTLTNFAIPTTGGNSIAGSDAVVIDTTHPVVSITNLESRQSSSVRRMTFSSSDTYLNYCQCRTEDSSWATCTSPSDQTVSALPDSSKTFRVRCYDQAGNQTATYQNIGLHIGNRSSTDCAGVSGIDDFTNGYCRAPSQSSTVKQCPSGWTSTNYVSYKSTNFAHSSACNGGSCNAAAVAYALNPTRTSCQQKTASTTWSWTSYGHWGTSCTYTSTRSFAQSSTSGSYVASCPASVSCTGGTFGQCTSNGSACSVSSCTNNCSATTTQYANFDRVGCY